MSELKTPRKALTQKKYRLSQEDKALTRYELQVNVETKARFEALVKVVADELETPWDPRRRQALARALLFDKVTSEVIHHFAGLNQQIEQLQSEIKALSPAFFIDSKAAPALPEAIHQLPDDPVQLKAILAKTFSEAQQAKQLAHKYKSSSEQYRKLHEVSTSYNDELTRQLKAAGLSVE